MLFKTVFTHKQIVDIAFKWIINNGSVGVAFKELHSLASEIPDVIGFGSWESVLIECKVSRSDFLKDKKKSHRTKGMGNWRFYCCPKGMIKVNELPQGWGLIYVDDNGKARIEFDCRKKKINEGWPQEWMKAEYPNGFERMIAATENKFMCDHEEERKIMYTALRRLFLRGRMEEIYTMKD